MYKPIQLNTVVAWVIWLTVFWRSLAWPKSLFGLFWNYAKSRVGTLLHNTLTKHAFECYSVESSFSFSFVVLWWALPALASALLAISPKVPCDAWAWNKYFSAEIIHKGVLPFTHVEYCQEVTQTLGLGPPEFTDSVSQLFTKISTSTCAISSNNQKGPGLEKTKQPITPERVHWIPRGLSMIYFYL